MNTILHPCEHTVNYCFHMMSTEKERAEHFGKWLRAVLNSRQMSQSELARRMGKDKGVIGNWVRGERLPSPESCDLIADVLVIPLDEVLAHAGHRPPDIELDPDSATARLMPLIEQIDWDARPGRLEGLEFELRQMIEWDRMKKKGPSAS